MCTGIVFRQATVEDLDQLVAARVAFITAVRASKPIEELVPDVDQFISLQREYLTEHLGTDQFIAFVAEDTGTIVGRSMRRFFSHYLGPTIQTAGGPRLSACTPTRPIKAKG